MFFNVSISIFSFQVFFFIVSIYLLKCLSLTFISLNLAGELIKGSKQESDRRHFMNPSQNSKKRHSVLFGLVLFCAAFWGSEQTEVPGEDISSILCDFL